MMLKKITIFAATLLAFSSPVGAHAAPISAVEAYIHSKQTDLRRVPGAERRMAKLLYAVGMREGVPALLLAKIINRESTFRVHARNGYCYGLMQVANFHFKAGQNPYNPFDNVTVGAQVLKRYYTRFPNWPQALTAYNMGPTAVASRGLSTSRYARQVLAGI